MMAGFVLTASMNIVLSLYFSIVRRSASCAGFVNPSASSRNITLRDTPIGLMRAVCLTLSRMKSIPLSSDALNSWKLVASKSSLCPNISRAKTSATVVLPIPGGPAKRSAAGAFLAKFVGRDTELPFIHPLMSRFNFSRPTNSDMVDGLYCSLQTSAFSGIVGL